MTLRLQPTSRRRRARDRGARSLLAMATLIALTPLFLIVYYLLSKGLGAWSWDFFTTDPSGRTCFPGQSSCSIGGVRSALVGTLLIVTLASIIAIPPGIAVAVYLVEYGGRSRFAQTVRYFIDVMTGVPSIVFGLFIYITLTLTGIGGGFAGWKGSVALALLMLPVVTRSSEVALMLVPASLRESALALGAPRRRVLTRVILPTALPGLMTGALLAVARAAGETAPLLFTAFSLRGISWDLGNQMNSMPVQIFNDITAPNDQIVERAWGAALALVAMILLLSLAGRIAQSRNRITP